MSIVTRVLDYVRPQRDGTVRVQERLTDHLGRLWFHTYKAESEDAANKTMNARDMTIQLKYMEERIAIDFIKNGGSPGDFIKVDLTDKEYNQRIAKKFASIKFDDDPDFLINSAAYILAFTVTQIENALLTTTVKAQKILDRATAIQNTLEPAHIADKADVQEDLA